MSPCLSLPQQLDLMQCPYCMNVYNVYVIHLKSEQNQTNYIIVVELLTVNYILKYSKIT